MCMSALVEVEILLLSAGMECCREVGLDWVAISPCPIPLGPSRAVAAILEQYFACRSTLHLQKASWKKRIGMVDVLGTRGCCQWRCGALRVLSHGKASEVQMKLLAVLAAQCYVLLSFQASCSVFELPSAPSAILFSSTSLPDLQNADLA